jgi:hypothetical protein
MGVDDMTDKTLRAADGSALDNARIEVLVAEAERGYDIAALRRPRWSAPHRIGAPRSRSRESHRS